MEQEIYELMKASGLAYDLMADGVSAEEIDEMVDMVMFENYL